jgi:hypothetical protein
MYAAQWKPENEWILLVNSLGCSQEWVERRITDETQFSDVRKRPWRVIKVKIVPIKNSKKESRCKTNRIS